YTIHYANRNIGGFYCRFDYRPDYVARTRAAVSLVSALVIFIIAYAWLDQLLHPLQPYVRTEPHPFRSETIDIKVYDFRNYEIQASPPKIEPLGIVEIEYYQTFGDWPRRLELTAPGCNNSPKALNLVMLRDRRPIPISLECGR